MGFKPGDFPAAERYYAHAISLPVHAGMTDSDIAHVVASVKAEVAPFPESDSAPAPSGATG